MQGHKRRHREQLDFPLSNKGRNGRRTLDPEIRREIVRHRPETLLRLPQRQNAAVRRQQPPWGRPMIEVNRLIPAFNLSGRASRVLLVTRSSGPRASLSHGDSRSWRGHFA